MKLPTIPLLAAALAAAIAAPSAIGVLTFEDGGTHVVNTTINDYIWVFDGPGATPTSVTFNAPADVTDWDFDFDSLYADDYSKITINGGTFAEDVSAYWHTQINMSGGTIGYDLWGFEDSRLTITGGMVNNDILALHSSRVTISGGTIDDDLVSDFRSKIKVSGGTVGDDVESYGSSNIRIRGGSFGEDIESYNRSTIDISGGTFAANGVDKLDSGFSAANRSTIILRGRSFIVDGVAIGLGITNISSASGKLSGMLLDGSTFANIDYERLSSNSTIRLIVSAPDATNTFGLLSLGFVGLAFVRRRAS